MTLLARLVAKEEGFGVPGAVPTVRHNPGDLRHAPNASHEGIGPNDIGIEPNDATGWEDLERQLRLDASRGLTLAQFVDKYAPASENNSKQYLAYLCVGLFADTPVSEALKKP